MGGVDVRRLRFLPLILKMSAAAISTPFSLGDASTSWVVDVSALSVAWQTWQSLGALCRCFLVASAVAFR